jgi:hypothetical protein
MTEPTSPTNLNADLDSSVEQTNTSSELNSEVRSELLSELPSSIRQDDETEFSPNIEQFNSPSIPQSDESEDATARLVRIRNELTQRIRERDAEELQRQIQQEIDDLQNSLDRRHRRQSDHYADLTYEERFPNYDVPQAPSSNSMSSSITAQEQPILPPLPTLPVKISKESIGLIDFKHVITLDGKITTDMAEKFSTIAPSRIQSTMATMHPGEFAKFHSNESQDFICSTSAQ